MGRLPRLGRSTLTGRFVSEFWRTVLMIAGVADTPAALRHLFDDSRLSASARRFLDETAVSMRKRWLHPGGSVIKYLIKIDCDGLLPKLYGHIIVPASVMQELGHVAAPAPVRRWLARVPVGFSAAQAGVARLFVSRFMVGLKADTQACASGFREALKRASRWQSFSAFKAGDHCLRGAHGLGNLLLRHVRFASGLDQGRCKSEFLS